MLSYQDMLDKNTWANLQLHFFFIHLFLERAGYFFHVMFFIILLSTRVSKAKLEVQTTAWNFYSSIKLLLFLSSCSHF